MVDGHKTYQDIIQPEKQHTINNTNSSVDKKPEELLMKERGFVSCIVDSLRSTYSNETLQYMMHHIQGYEPI
jgi:hypothetical protein